MELVVPESGWVLPVEKSEMEGWQFSVGQRRLTGPAGELPRLPSLPLYSLLLFLAYRRKTSPKDASWVSVDDIARLPGWERHRPDSIGKDIQRYIRGEVPYPIAYERATRGPYRFDAPPESIRFDAPLPEIQELLGLSEGIVPTEEDMAAPLSPRVLSFVRALAETEGARSLGWSRPEYLAAYERLQHAADDPNLPSILRFLGLDRILTLELYASHLEQFTAHLELARRLADGPGSPELQPWMEGRLFVHTVRLLLRQERYAEAQLEIRQANSRLARQPLTYGRTLADLYNSQGIALGRLRPGDPVAGRQALGLLFRALLLRMLFLSFDEIHDSCINIAACLGNDLGDLESGLCWLVLAEVVRESCGTGAYSGLPDFSMVSMLRRLAGSEDVLHSRAVHGFLEQNELLQTPKESIEHFIEERLAAGFRRCEDFDDRRGLLTGYRVQGSIRWAQKRYREVYEDVVRYVHTARQLGEEERLHKLNVALEQWSGPAEELRSWVWRLRLKGLTVPDVPKKAFDRYVEAFEEWIEAQSYNR